MTYVLENCNEFGRLERQSRLEAYDFRAELADLEVKGGARILDAGCGSGIVSRFLAERHPRAEVTGCDFGKGRLAEARKASAHLGNLNFDFNDLTRLGYPRNRFDLIVCRYVLHHLSKETRRKVLAEFGRCLNPGGMLCIIDIDGLFCNLYPQTPFLSECLSALEKSPLVDLRVGRKLSFLSGKAGLVQLNCRVETLLFDGGSENMQAETQMCRERLVGAQKFFAEVLGTQQRAARFTREYLKSLERPGSLLFYNKFILHAVKPKTPGLRLVRGK